eukprot:TRINITY_DN6820_c0_g1_i1.p1 TRINITY_DN6820_c0_g1~~TRINITY_DN6820_c0_g1_i1.p1  ORF type:complete len:187 (-),score=31.63 TRINITY_DN6820_c0_g1_i1:132-692(-)
MGCGSSFEEQASFVVLDAGITSTVVHNADVLEYAADFDVAVDLQWNGNAVPTNGESNRYYALEISSEPRSVTKAGQKLFRIETSGKGGVDRTLISWDEQQTFVMRNLSGVAAATQKGMEVINVQAGRVTYLLKRTGRTHRVEHADGMMVGIICAVDKTNNLRIRAAGGVDVSLLMACVGGLLSLQT